MQDDRFVLGKLVNNQAGVLTRVSSLFGRRGYNIDSLSVGETENAAVSRITVVSRGDESMRGQVVHQLEKLHDVLQVEVLDPERTVCRELMMIKVHLQPEQLAQVQETAKVFRAKIVDLAPTSLTAEITGLNAKLDAFIKCLEPYGITELCRTGLTAIGRGDYTLNGKNKEEE